MRWRIGIGFAVLAGAVALAGCAKDGGSRVASVTGDATAGASAPPSLDPHQLGLKFAQCMRDNGVDMEDPVEGGGVRVRVEPGQEETARKAREACRRYTPAANGAKPDPQMVEKARELARCMRSNGVEDFPDPDPNQLGAMINRELTKDPDFQKAREACQDIIGGLRPPGGSPAAAR